MTMTDAPINRDNGRLGGFHLDWECQVCGEVWQSREGAEGCAEKDYDWASEARNPLREW